MADEKAVGNNPANAGDGGKGSSRNNRRRTVRSKRRGRKPEEGGNKPDARPEPRTEPRADARKETRNEGRTEPRKARAVRGQQSPPSDADKSVRENRERRRRRRMRAKQRGQNESGAVVVEDGLKDLPPLVPAFVYTHVLRPAGRDSFEFRTEHFSKVTRKLEDFHIDLSPLYPDGGDEIKGVAWMPPVSERPLAEDDREFDDGGYDDEYEDDEREGGDDASPATRRAVDDTGAELFENPDWDAEESEDAARLDGALADDFYAEMDDSGLDDAGVDEYPDEELDD